jgi:ATP-binding cassette, subfamily B, bacterial
VFRLRKTLFERLIRLGIGRLNDMKTGGIVSRLSGDVDAVTGLVQLALIGPAVAAIQVLLTVAIILVKSPQLAVASLVLLPPLGTASWLWLRKVRPIYRSMRDDRGEIDGRVAETFGGIRVIRSFRREKREEHAYAVGHHTVIRKGLRAEWMEIVLSTVWGLLIPGISVLIVWYGGFLVLEGKASTGTIFMFQIYAILLVQPVWQIVSSLSQTQRSLAAVERVFDVMHMAPDKPDAPDAVDSPAADNIEEMRFDRVSFSYRPDVPVIREFSLAVRGGQTVALVGPSGAGKTTITDLVARFQDPDAGAVLLNGIDLRKIRLASYRRLLSVVPQEVFLFDGTVRENIAYGRRGAGEQQIADAARRANAHEFIEKLPEAYDTLIGERGFKLSGGQRQRLSIARAILADPAILILDEATSNLDTESEQLIQASLRDLFRGRTTFVIAHRLSTIAHADIIVAMDKGQIVETGTHEELMSRGGFYFDMVERQRRSFDRDGGSDAKPSDSAAGIDPVTV